MLKQIQIEARRQFEVTVHTATTSINVTVKRNEFAPRFTKEEYRKEGVSEKLPVGTKILTVSASDKDGVSSFKCYCVFQITFIGHFNMFA